MFTMVSLGALHFCEGHGYLSLACTSSFVQVMFGWLNIAWDRIRRRYYIISHVWLVM